MSNYEKIINIKHKFCKYGYCKLHIEHQISCGICKYF